MLRVAVTVQLVLTLLLGPLLCCCTVARLGHGSAASRVPDRGPGEKPVRKHCCGDHQPEAPPKPTPDKKPANPDKCPCKGDQKDVAVAPDAPLTAAETVTLFSGVLPPFDLPVRFETTFATSHTPVRFEHRSSTPSAWDVLYAHHNLLC